MTMTQQNQRNLSLAPIEAPQAVPVHLAAVLMHYGQRGCGPECCSAPASWERARVAMTETNQGPCCERAGACQAANNKAALGSPSRAHDVRRAAL